MESRERCIFCGAEFDPPVVKWNGGNPVEISFPSCTCEEDKLFAELKVRFNDFS